MYNLEIQFNKNILQKLKSYHFNADQTGSALFVLFALYENNIELLDEFDDSNVQRRALFLYKELEIRRLIEPNREEGGSHFKITKLGRLLVEYIKSEFRKELNSVDIAVKGVETPTEETPSVNKDDVEHWINDWLDLFPRGVRTSGKLVRSDKQACLNKMRVFLREYPYDRDTILEATRKYVESKEQDGYNFMRCAVYFIYRVEGSITNKSSDLAAWCEDVTHNRKKGNNQSENNIEIMV